MTNVTEGVVQKIGSKTGEGKYGSWTKFSVKINEEWYGGFENKENKETYASVNEGDFVKVKYVVKGDYKNIDKLKVVDKATTSGASSTTKSSSSKAVDWEKKDLRAQRGFARSQAIAAVEILVLSEAIKLPAKQSAKYDALLAIIDELAEKYFVWEPEQPKAVVVDAEDNAPDKVDTDTSEAVAENFDEDDGNEAW